jgi:Icc-related predicted phosphoesterase
MFDGLQPFAELGVPVYVIPGNHEERDVYRQGLAMLQQQYPQVIDVNGKAVDAGGAHLVGLGGYYLKNFIPDDGFLTNATSYAAAERQLKSFRAEAPVIFVTHSPPLGRSKIDLVEGVGHVGDANITRILSGTSVFHVCGHIHEGGGTFEQFNRSTSYNAASITPYMDPDAPRTTVFIVNKTIVPAGR